MRSRVQLAAIILLLSFSPIHTYAQSTRDGKTLAEGISEMSAKIASPDITGKAIRIAIIPLVPTSDADKGSKDFGRYFADQFTTKLKSASASIKIFERDRLKLVTDELELGQSGIIDSDNAKRIGQLAPVDALFSGSYTVVKPNVEINAKLIHVVTGEILATCSAKIFIDEGLQDFFMIKPDNKSAINNDSNESPCKAAYDAIKIKLNDISTDEKISQVVKEAMKYPLFGDCYAVHSAVINTFIRYKKQNNEYHNFLVAQMSKTELIEATGDMYLVFDVMKYFAVDGAIDDREFDAGLHASQVMRTHYFNVPFRYLLESDLASPDRMSIVQRRIDRIMSLIDAKKMGLPYPVDYFGGYDELMGALHGYAGAIIYTCKKYSARVPEDKREKLSTPLKRAFNDTKDSRYRDELIILLADFYNSRPVDKKLTDDLYQFAQSLDRKETDRIWCAKLVILTKKTLSQAILLYPYNKKDNILFCLRYDIPCPQLIPSADEIVRNFQFGDSLQIKCEAGEYLEAMDARAKFAETNVIKVLKYIENDTINGMGSANLHEQCLNILGNIKTNNPESLTWLQKGLVHNYSDISKAAANAMFKIGKPSVPYIVKALSNNEKYAKLNALKLLSRMGKDAKDAAGELNRIMKAEKDEFIKDSIADILKRIQ